MASATAFAMLAAGCASSDVPEPGGAAEGSDDGGTGDPDPRDGESTDPDPALTTGDLFAALPALLDGELLAEVGVSPAVVEPGGEIVVSSPSGTTAEVIGPGGAVAEVTLDGGEGTLQLPADIGEGEYLVVVRPDGPGISIGTVRLANGPSIWISADRLNVAADDTVRLRVESSGVDPTTPVFIGLGEGWEAELSDEEIEYDESDYVPGSDDYDFGEGLEAGPTGVVTPTEAGLLVARGFEPVNLGDLTGRDLYLPGAQADTVQVISLTDESLFSNPVDITRCNEAATVAGSIGGPGGVRILSVSSQLESVAALTDTGEFSVSVPAGAHMLFGWLGDDPPAPLVPQPIDAPCGGTVRVGAATDVAPEESIPVLTGLDPAFAVGPPPCRTVVIAAIEDESGATLPGVTEVVAATLRSRLPLAEIAALSDFESIVDHAFDPGWIRPGSLVSLRGFGDRLNGDVYVQGVQHQSGGSLASFSRYDGDFSLSRDGEGPITDWIGGFAADMARSALCIQAPPLHSPSNAVTEWPVWVTDLAGDAYQGATVAVTSSSGAVDPPTTSVGDGPATFEYSAGSDTQVDELTTDVTAEVAGNEIWASETFLAGVGFTYQLIGANRVATIDDDALPLAGNVGAAMVACSSQPQGPYTGIFAVELADFFLLAGIGGALLGTLGLTPVGEATPRYDFPRPRVGAEDALLPLVFGIRDLEIAYMGAALWGRYVEVLEGMTKAGAVVGKIDGASFDDGSITLLENDGNKLIGTLNEQTGTVTVTAGGLSVLTAEIVPADTCSITLS